MKPNDPAAAYWYSAAAAQGHRAAEWSLGGMYEEGEGGLPKNLKKATELYIKSANQGYDRAQFALGVQYELGQEVPRSRAKAIELLRASRGQQALWIAQVLTDPKTPARFASEHAFGNYLAGLRNAEFTAAWAQAHPAGGGLGLSGVHLTMTPDEVTALRRKTQGIRPEAVGGFRSAPRISERLLREWALETGGILRSRRHCVQRTSWDERHYLLK